MTKVKSFAQMFATSLLATTIIAGVTNAEAQFCDYNNDNTTENGAVVCEAIDIRGSSTTTFNNTLTVAVEGGEFNIYNTASPTFSGTSTINNNDYPMFIYNDSAPVFSGTVFSKSITISDNAQPIFLGNMVITQDLRIEDSSAPNFSGNMVIGGDLRIENTSTPTFQANFTVDGELRITTTSNLNLIGSTKSKYINIYSSDVQFSGPVHATEDIIMESGTKTVFLGDTQVDGNIDLINDAKPSFSGTLTAVEMRFIDVSDATATFTENSVLDAPVTTDGFASGNLIFKSGATVNKSIGTQLRPLANVTFEADNATKTTTLKSDIYSGEIHFGGLKIDIQDNLKLVSTNLATEHLNNTTLMLNGNTLTQSGNVVNDAGNITFNTLFVSQAHGIGHIEQTDGNFDMVTNTAGVIINLTENPMIPLPIENVPENYDLFVEGNGGSFTLADNGDVTLNSPENPFVLWSHADGIVTRTLVDNPEEVLEEEIGGNNPNLSLITPALVTELTNIAASEGGDVAAETLDRLVSADALALATTPVGRVAENATQSISDRANGFTATPLQVVQSEVTGVAAGDTNLRHGAWISPFAGLITQRVRGTTPGYKAIYYGAVIGADTLLNDDVTVGVAFSAIKTDVKHKNLNVGDKTKANTYVGSLYGTYQLNNKWFMQGVALFSRTKIKNQEVRRQFGNAATARANYISDGWGSELLLGCNHKIAENLLVTPTFGFEYNRMNQIKYKETGTINQNLLVTRKAVNRIEAIAGARVSTSYQHKDWLIIPEAHGNIRYDVNGKKLNVDIRQDGSTGPSLVPRTSKVSRTIGNLGIAINARTNETMEYGIGYDIRLAEKYIGHQGTLKIRMNF